MTVTALDEHPDAADLGRFRDQGCDRAFAAMVARHQPGVRAACAAVLGSRHPWLDDACQTVFDIFARRCHELRDPAAVGAWLRVTARGVAANLRRAESRRHERERVVGADVTPATSVGQSDEARRHLDEALASLTEAQRAALMPYIFSGRTQAEVAAELGISEGAVKKRVADAVAALRGWYTRRGIAMPSVVAVMASPDAGTTSALAPTGGSGGASPGVWTWCAMATAVVLAAVSLATPVVPAQPVPAPIAIAAPIPTATGMSEEDAILAPVRALRRNDLGGLLAALPDRDRELALARWQRFVATPAPGSDALADLGLALARRPDAFAVSSRLHKPMTRDLLDGFGAAADRLEAAGDTESARTLRMLRSSLVRWASGEQLDSERIARAVTARRLATAEAFGIDRVADLRRLDVDETIVRLDRVLASFKAWWRPYGMDLDRVLDSVAVERVEGTAERREAVVRFTAFGREHQTRVRLVRDGGGWRWSGLGTILEQGFRGVSAYFYLPPELLERAPIRPAAGRPG